ncbi:MAG TPA: Ltp family lipoprotein [Candidatus Agathobaculum stercoravium]|nr:Ltp family lipoprotein [Candidatus Agathobaculum stercoravium]
MKRNYLALCLVMLLALMGCGNTSDSASADDAQTTQSEQTDVADEPVEQPVEDPTAGMTMSQANAYKSALSYLDLSAFSRSGLIEQLEFEGYSTEDATFAVDKCDADWAEQAEKSAQSYLEYSAFSQQGLIDLLVFEGFSNEDATAAAANCGADWNEQAAKSAQNYLEFSSFSRQGLIDQLVYEGFTQAQAEYGVTAAGY